jgi:hypothetical protein
MPKKARKAVHKKKQSVIKGVLGDTNKLAGKIKSFWK